MGMTRICFLDTETTSLRPDRRVWEIGMIIRDPDGAERARHWFISAADLDLANADPAALRIGRFYERHPDRCGRHLGLNGAEAAVLEEVERITRGATLVGINPAFDADGLGTRMRARGILPAWHYRLVDTHALTAGWAHRHAAYPENLPGKLDEAARLRAAASPPFDPEFLREVLGVKPPAADERHTAIGDARLARDIYDAVTGSAS